MEAKELGKQQPLNLVASIFFIFSVLGQVNSEIRFCHKGGPQKVDQSECPYGIFFKQPITAKCMFYAPDETTSKAPTYSSDACSADQVSLAPNTKLESTVIQKLEFGDRATDEETETRSGSFDPINDPSCIQECFEDVDPWSLYKADEELPEYNHAAASCPLEVLDQNLNTSEVLFDYLLFGQETEAKIPNNRIHQLLELCSLILLKHCGHPYIKADFLLQALEAVKYLHFTANKGKVLEVSASTFSAIEERLKICLDTPISKFRVSGLECASKAKIETIEYRTEGEPRRLKYRLEPKSYRFGKFDLFVEAAWAGLEFAHSYCFEEFRDFPYEYDMLVEHVGHIFSITAVEQLWYCPIDLQNDGFWNNLAGVGDVKWTMRNVDFCAQAAAKTSVFSYRLDRTFETEADSPDSQLIGPPTDQMGWNGTEEAYWKEYSKAGGLKKQLEDTDEGFCPSNPRDLEIFKQQFGLTC